MLTKNELKQQLDQLESCEEALRMACDALDDVSNVFSDIDPAFSAQARVMLDTVEDRLRLVAPGEYENAA